MGAEDAACGSTRISCVWGWLKLSSSTRCQGSGFPDLLQQAPGMWHWAGSRMVLPQQPSASSRTGAGLEWRSLLQPRTAHGWAALSAPPVGQHMYSPFLMVSKGQRAQIWAKDPPSARAGCGLILVLSLQSSMSCLGGSEHLPALPLQPFCSSSREDTVTHPLLSLLCSFPGSQIPK